VLYEATVRSEFDYEEGARQDAASRIIQLGEKDETFNTHTFSYYDEVQTPGASASGVDYAR
jgi:hypothetical protein